MRVRVRVRVRVSGGVGSVPPLSRVTAQAARRAALQLAQRAQWLESEGEGEVGAGLGRVDGGVAQYQAVRGRSGREDEGGGTPHRPAERGDARCRAAGRDDGGHLVRVRVRVRVRVG